MNKKVKIEGLDCPNCALSLEKALSKIEGVQNLKIEFVTSSLSFDSENVEESLKEIVKLTKKLEPNAKITDGQAKEKHIDVNLIVNVALIVIGVGLGFVLYFVDMPAAAYWPLYVLCALLLGYKTYYKAAVLLTKGVINENLLITLSVIGASFVGEHMEGIMVIALYSIGKIFEGLATDKSRKSIEALIKLQPEYATLVTENGEERVRPEEVKEGSIIIVKAGERVPIDGKIIEGQSDFNLQSLTGESLPVMLKEGQEVLSGSIAIDGVVKIKTTTILADSTISKIMNLVEHAQENKSKTETFISKLTKYYTLGVIVAALLVWGIVWAVTKNFDMAVYRGLIFLVVSCPCAFAISVPLAYFSGLGNASKNGVLIKGSNYLDECSKLKAVAFDKTGTLTTGEFTIEDIKSFDESFSENDILFLAANAEQFSLHPIAKAILKEAREKGFKEQELKDVKEIAGKGVNYSYNGHSYFVGKGELETKATTASVFMDNKLIGEITLSDSLKSSSIEACKELKELGIKTMMLSGDSSESVEKISSKLSLDEKYCQLLPQDKYNIIEKCKKEGLQIGYVGDGINDAPSLSLADVGISMGINGSPASIEASDIVLVDDNPLKIVKAIKISKFTKKIVIENIVFSAVVKVLFLLLGAIGITGMLSAVFADVGVTLIAILNSMRALRKK